MNFKKRLDKLKGKLNPKEELWATFLIRYYENSDETERVKAYLSNGNALPAHQVFIQDAGRRQEGYDTSFFRPR